MNHQTDESNEPEGQDSEPFPPRTARPSSKLRRVLPTTRGSFKTQVNILKGYGAAAESHGGLVSLGNVADACGLSKDTVSVCNEFFRDVGLLARQGRRFKPSADVLEFVRASHWNADTAGHMLSQAIRRTWFGQATLTRLTVRSLSKEDIIEALAQEAGASIDHKPRVEMLIDYLEFSGVIRRNGDLYEPVREGVDSRTDDPSTQPTTADSPPSPTSVRPGQNDTSDDLESFSIQLPGLPTTTLSVPKTMLADDWKILSGMIDLYLKRLDAKHKKNEPGTEPGS